MKKLVVLTGAGISAESGIKTFRDHNGLWENYDVMDVASIEGWRKNRELVLDFYNQRRRQLQEVQSNEAHQILQKLEQHFEVHIVTQNVDDLHERAGSSNILHLHGELLKSCASQNKNLVYNQLNDIQLGDKAEDGSQLRPFIVWFGEEVPLMEKAQKLVQQADIVIVIGTSLQVYPAAGLLYDVKADVPLFVINPDENIQYNNRVEVIKESATQGMKMLWNRLVEMK